VLLLLLTAQFWIIQGLAQHSEAVSSETNCASSIILSHGLRMSGGRVGSYT